jgi:hypothetical protein
MEKGLFSGIRGFGKPSGTLNDDDEDSSPPEPQLENATPRKKIIKNSFTKEAPVNGLIYIKSSLIPTIFFTFTVC